MFHNQMNKSQKEPAAAKAKGVKEQCVYVEGRGGGQITTIQYHLRIN